MKEFIDKYNKEFIELFKTSKMNDEFDINLGIKIVCNIIKKQFKLGGKVYFIGNGGSAAIASHMAIDFWKNGKIPAMTFNDSSLLTCISNDFGYSRVFEKPIEQFMTEKDILFAISSSGQSKNIFNGVREAQLKDCTVITLSGFEKDNLLKSSGNYNFYVPSCQYGYVEMIHQYICHCIIDAIINEELDE